MTTRPLSVNATRAPVLWLLGTALGWSLVPPVLNGLVMRTYLDVARVLPVYLLLGLVVGAVTGLGQMQVWSGAAALRWLWATVLAYGLALPAGLVIGKLIPSVAWGLRTGTFGFMPLVGQGSVTFMPYPAAVIFGGFVVGLCQWRRLKRWLAPARPPMGWLWVFGVWAGIGLGFFVAGSVVPTVFGSDWRLSLSLALHGLLWGAATGSISLAVLWILQRESRQLTR
jgi:hypothetical protein